MFAAHTGLGARRWRQPPSLAPDDSHPRYLQAGSPSAADVIVGFVVLMLIPQGRVVASCEWVTVADQKPAPVTIAGLATPVELWNFSAPIVAVYFELSEKNASSAVTRLRRSDFIAVTYA